MITESTKPLSSNNLGQSEWIQKLASKKKDSQQKLFERALKMERSKSNFYQKKYSDLKIKV
jgi:hypothetical protein